MTCVKQMLTIHPILTKLCLRRLIFFMAEQYVDSSVLNWRGINFDIALRQELTDRGCVVQGRVEHHVLVNDHLYQGCDMKWLPKETFWDVCNAEAVVSLWLNTLPDKPTPHLFGGWWATFEDKGTVVRGFFAK